MTNNSDDFDDDTPLDKAIERVEDFDEEVDLDPHLKRAMEHLTIAVNEIKGAMQKRGLLPFGKI